MTISSSPDPTELNRSRALRWLGLAVASLVGAGALAILLVVGRVPPLSTLLTNPELFKRCLVVHVDLALVVWFYAFLAALFVLIPSRTAPNTVGRNAVALGFLGVALLIAAAAVPGVRPVLANYLPVLDHPLYVIGLVALGAALAFTLLDPRLLPGNEATVGAVRLPSAAIPLLRAGAVAVLLALVTFAAAWRSTTPGLPLQEHYEAIVWGGGHVLQFASVAGMLAAWILLLTPVIGQSPVGRGTAALLGGVLVTPLFGAPLLAFGGTGALAYRVGFTRLMQFGIAPVVVVFLFLCIRALLAARRTASVRLLDPRVTGFLASATLTLAGFTLGALIAGPNTVVPAHYHASIGGVTVSFMALTYPLLEALGLPSAPARLRRLVAWQPLLLGFGQLVFASGFALAGAHGMARKSYASEQQIRTTAESIGLGIMGVGGIVAVAGGLLFLFLVGAIWRRHLHTLRTPEVIHVRR